MSEQLPITLPKSNVTLTLRKKGLPNLLIAVMRPHQWVKNLFIFAPLLFARRLTDLQSVGAALTAIGVFCLLSSSLYIFNDWLDAEEDRVHPEKKNRPISSGELSVTVALTFSAALALTAFAISWQLGPAFLFIALAYYILTITYCLSLKRFIILDCIIIAIGFVLRVVGGAVAVGVAASHWLIVCAFLLALFLAFSKRRQELLKLSSDAFKHRAVLNQYSVSYLGQVNVILIAAAIVCYALYTVAPETIEKFSTENLIYGTVFVIYGMLRYMALIENPENGGNPSKLLARDKPLIITLAAWAIYNTVIIYSSSLSELFAKFL